MKRYSSCTTTWNSSHDYSLLCFCILLDIFSWYKWNTLKYDLKSENSSGQIKVGDTFLQLDLISSLGHDESDNLSFLRRKTVNYLHFFQVFTQVQKIIASKFHQLSALHKQEVTSIRFMMAYKLSKMHWKLWLFFLQLKKDSLCPTFKVQLFMFQT